MRKSVKIWLDALRSGEYKQCQGALEAKLRDGSSGFCCLGVATQKASEAGIAVGRDDEGKLNGGSLAPPVMQWLGIKTSGGVFGTVFIGANGLGAASLIGLNDAVGFTFPEIADAIESRYDELFYPEEEHEPKGNT